MLEELASHGYVVVAPSHAYLTPFTLDSGGAERTFSRSHPRLLAHAEEERSVDFDALESALRPGAPADRLMPTLQAYYEQSPIDEAIVATWARDISFVLDELAPSADHIFSGLIDSERIGVLGFSRGGRAAGLVALQDARVRAGVSIDGWQPLPGPPCSTTVAGASGLPYSA